MDSYLREAARVLRAHACSQPDMLSAPIRIFLNLVHMTTRLSSGSMSSEHMLLGVSGSCISRAVKNSVI